MTTYANPSRISSVWVPAIELLPRSTNVLYGKQSHATLRWHSNVFGSTGTQHASHRVVIQPDIESRASRTAQNKLKPVTLSIQALYVSDSHGEISCFEPQAKFANFI